MFNNILFTIDKFGYSALPNYISDNTIFFLKLLSRDYLAEQQLSRTTNYAIFLKSAKTQIYILIRFLICKRSVFDKAENIISLNY